MKNLTALALAAVAAMTLCACDGPPDQSPESGGTAVTTPAIVTLTPTAPIPSPASTVKVSEKGGVFQAVKYVLDQSSKDACEGSKADFLYGVDNPADTVGNEVSAQGALISQRYGVEEATAAAQKVCDLVNR